MPTPADFPVLHTPRLILRRMSADDLPLLFRGMSDPRVTEYYGISYETQTLTQAQLDWFELIWASGTGIWWGLCFSHAPHVLIGTCGINEWEQEHHCAEAGFWIFPEYWGQGIMHESLQAMLAYCFKTLGIHRMQMLIEPANLSSWKLAERLGFQLEGVLRECERKQDHYADLKCYSLLASEWPYSAAFL
ncbi:GNAT family N-acetyltransferase [Undibacterium griseum]|uniref:GNAT family N-acetyltransferase n=1 Tax=Undibacterium griseum TaxID=2762295 RepID=A0ABR6YN24_9BURK|nr:GNAT family protein [Undibacterium griseum]MBC3885256.1 GNAT family N-acetyltransferase [Undibacterium griseum]